jgi:hypothetical protein
VNNFSSTKSSPGLLKNNYSDIPSYTPGSKQKLPLPIMLAILKKKRQALTDQGVRAPLAQNEDFNKFEQYK